VFITANVDDAEAAAERNPSTALRANGCVDATAASSQISDGGLRSSSSSKRWGEAAIERAARERLPHGDCSFRRAALPEALVVYLVRVQKEKWKRS
jgi:hypothetical protein